MTVTPSMTAFPLPPVYPLTQITPFTYRDGMTYLQVLNGIRGYISDELVPAFNTIISEVSDRIIKSETDLYVALNEFIETIQTQFDTMAAESAQQAIDAYLVATPIIVRTLTTTSGELRAAIQTEIDSLPETGGVVRILRGDYTMSGTVQVNKPVRFVAEGPVKISGANNFFTLDAHNVSFTGIEFSGNNQGFLSQKEGSNYNGLVIQDCTFDRVSLGLTKRGRLQTATGTVVLSGTGVSTNARISGCEIFGFTGTYAIYIAGPADTIVENTYIHDVGTDAGIGDGIKISDDSTGTRIVNNIIENVTRDAMDIFSASESYISGNIMRNPGVMGIDQKSADNSESVTGRDIIVGNRVYNAGQTSYAIKTGDVLISNNFSHDSKGDGFFIANRDGGVATPPMPRIQLIGNVAINSVRNGFNLQVGKDWSVVGNSAHGSTLAGMSIGQDTSGFTVTGNTLTDNVVADLQLSTGPTDHFMSGNTTDDATPGNSLIIPNNQNQWAYLSNGARAAWLNILSSDTMNLGSASFPSLNIIAGNTVNVLPNVSLRQYLIHTGERVGFYGKTPVVQAGNPGTATGTDAAVINNIVNALRGIGIVQ